MKIGWQQSEEYVGDLVRSVKANGSKIAIIIFPNRAQIDPSELTYMKADGEVTDPRLYSDSATRKEMLMLCSKNNWPCLDLQTPLRSTSNPAKLFLNNDIHLTKAGNIIAAHALFNYLVKNKIIY